MKYTSQQLKALSRDRESVLAALEELLLVGLGQAAAVNNQAVRDQLSHGVGRRLTTMRRCVQRTFELFPPSREQPLPRDVLHDLQIYLQAFILNLSGVFDNWAWAFVLRHGVQIDRVNVGLFRSQTQRVLPPGFTDYLTSKIIGTWHVDYLKEGRDSLAHRIPQYIPPIAWTAEEAKRFEELKTQETACFEARDWDRLRKIQDEQANLGRAAPVFLGEITRQGKQRAPQLLHPQLLADCRTVDEIGRRFYNVWHERA